MITSGYLIAGMALTGHAGHRAMHGRLNLDGTIDAWWADAPGRVKQGSLSGVIGALWPPGNLTRHDGWLFWHTPDGLTLYAVRDQWMRSHLAAIPSAIDASTAPPE